MSENLPVIPQMQSLQKYDENDFDDLTSGGWLPRVQLCIGQSIACQEYGITPNNYALVEDQTYQDLGSSIDIAIFVWRPKAMIAGGDQPFSVYDRNNPLFQEVIDKSMGGSSEAMFGIEFLVYVPAFKKFATFFFGNKSARRTAKKVKVFVGKAATFTSKKLSSKSYTWYTPEISICSTPFDMPPEDIIIEEIDKFNNPPAPNFELADDSDKEEENRAR